MSEYIQSWEGEERDLFRQRLSPEFAALESYSTPTLPFQSLFRRLEERVFSSPKPAATFQQLSRSLKRRFPHRFEFAYFGGDDRPLGDLCDMPIPITAARRFLPDYRAFNEGTLDSLKNHVSFIKTFFGPFVPSTEPIHGQLLPAAERDSHAFTYLSAPRSTGTFIAFLNTGKGWQFSLLRHHLSRLNRRSNRIFGDLIDLHAPPSSWTPRFKLSPAEGRELVSRLRQQAVSWLWDQQQLWFSRELFSGRLLLVRATFFPSPRLAQAKRIAGWFPFGLGLVVILLWGSQGSGLPGSSVRSKLIGAFLLASFLPLSVMSVTALRFLQEKQRIDEHRLRATLARHLQSLDQTYADNLSGIEATTRKAFQAFRVPEGKTAAQVLASIKNWKTTIQYDSLRVIGNTGSVVTDDRSGGDRFGFSPQAFILSRLAEKILASIDLQQGTASRYLLNPDEYSEQDLLLTHLGKSVYQIRSFDNGVSKLMLGIFPVFDRLERPRFLAQFMWRSGKLQQGFLLNRIPSYAHRNNGIEILAWNRARPDESCPPSFRHRPRIASFLEQIRIPGSVFHTRRPFHDGSLFFAGIRGTHLQDYTLVAAANDFAIRSELSRIRWGFTFVGIIIVIISGLTAFHLSGAVLRPVDDLAQGVLAIQRRDFQYRLPPGEADEYAKLTGAFNDMMENLSDLEVARLIQDTLFPEAPLKQGVWEVAGRMFSTATVGGDYFDYFSIDAERILIAIGDVSGRGVSAALGVAMAKALIQPTSAGSPLPDLLGHLHHVLRTSFGEKLIMSVCLFRWSSLDGVFECASGGHVPPLLFGPGGLKSLALDGTPLGGRTPPRIALLRGQVRAGESVLFSTDPRFSLEKGLGPQLKTLITRSFESTSEIMQRIALLQNELLSLTAESPAERDRTIVVMQTSLEASHD